MSTSLLYHALRSRFEKGAAIFSILKESRRLRCSVCGSRRVIRRGSKLRRFRGVPIGSRPVWIAFSASRRRYVLELCRFATIKEVARHLRVSWGVIKDIKKRHLRRCFRRVETKYSTH